jgi:hypothetical protein
MPSTKRVKSEILICVPPRKRNEIDEGLISTGIRSELAEFGIICKSAGTSGREEATGEVCSLRIHGASLRVRDSVECGDAGLEQSFKVPAGVTQVTIAAGGASGAAGFGYYYGSYAAPGGLGGRVKATIPVTPKERLAIFVGGSGSDGGFNGGGKARNPLATAAVEAAEAARVERANPATATLMQPAGPAAGRERVATGARAADRLARGL